MSRIITARPLVQEEFAEFGEIIQIEGAKSFPINAGKCMRYHGLARAEAEGPNAHVLINLFRAQPYDFPLMMRMVERHPFGSQAFMPLNDRPFLVAVCHDTVDGPGRPEVFLTKPGQGVNYPRNLWHGLLTPIGEPQDFLVVDRGGDGVNLEEHYFDEPWEIRLPDGKP